VTSLRHFPFIGNRKTLHVPIWKPRLEKGREDATEPGKNIGRGVQYSKRERAWLGGWGVDRAGLGSNWADLTAKLPIAVREDDVWEVQYSGEREKRPHLLVGLADCRGKGESEKPYDPEGVEKKNFSFNPPLFWKPKVR